MIQHELAGQLAFFRALNGEFSLSSDKSYQIHTLGAIAIDTLMHDETNTNGIITAAAPMSSSYRLPWAPNVVATVLSYTDIATENSSLVKVELTRDSIDEDSESDRFSVGKLGDEITLVTPGHAHTYPLFSGELPDVSYIVAVAAKNFFDKAD